jgi:hypothetical protein
MSLIISSYQLLKESVESEFKLTFNIIQSSGVSYNLKYPSNPILDCQIINLHDQPLQQVVIKLLKLIEEDEFGFSTRIELIQFKNWIIKIVNLGSSNPVDLE